MKTPPFKWILLFFLHTTTCWFRVGSTPIHQELLKGFKATPNPSISSFQPLLTDSTGNYSLGFLRVNRTRLALSILHVPSAEQFWIANPTRLARWSHPTQLFFNGSLVITDTHTGLFWSTNTNGDRVCLSNISNLEIQKVDGPPSILWQSFHFPYNTLVEDQNFTSAMSLVSSNGLYSMRLGFDFIGLYAKFKRYSDPGQIYLKHKALEAKADVIQGQGPIYAVLHPDGFLGMYQNGSVPVDVQSFYSFQQPGSGNRRIRLETDGNLKGYYWTGSSWTLDFQAISDPCELPSPCGSYSICRVGKGCSCLDNRTEYDSGRSASPDNTNSGDLCSAHDSKYWVMRRSGVELPYKELMAYEKKESLEECESSCEISCTCWGAVYSNSSGFCYKINYPIQTLLGVGDESKVGYFKVREGAGNRKVGVWFGVGVGSLCGVILVWIVGLGWCRFRRSKGVANGYEEQEGGVGVGPYKDLASASFRSIQLSER
ncbi:hypothetical protein LguiA_016004 [Lonicera macranthoides]